MVTGPSDSKKKRKFYLYNRMHTLKRYRLCSDEMLHVFSCCDLDLQWNTPSCEMSLLVFKRLHLSILCSLYCIIQYLRDELSPYLSVICHDRNSGQHIHAMVT